MKKGFTLIELLAVIVILAVILLIAVPAVKKTVNNAKKKSAENDARMIKNIAEKYYTSNLDKDEEITGIDLSSDILSYSGKKPSKGYLYYNEDGIAYGKMHISGYCVEILNNGTITSDKTDENECIIEKPQKRYANGRVVIYNPEINMPCHKMETVSVTGTKTGCMKWYIFNDEGSSKVNLILDHNTTAAVDWISKEDYIAAGGTEAEWGDYGNNSKGPITLLKQLKSDTSTWNKTINARLIEASEIAKITNNTTWTAGIDYYYFHDNTQIVYQGAAGTNKYAWLFDNTKYCTTFGCNVADSSNDGYWTGTVYSNNSYRAWGVSAGGGMGSGVLAEIDTFGVRPVITVDKALLKDQLEAQ